MSGTTNSMDTTKLMRVGIIVLALVVLLAQAVTAVQAASSTAPIPPSVPDLVAASDTGWFDNDNITANTTLTFAGTVKPKATVKLFAGTALVGRGKADRTTGTYQITTTLPEGVHAMAVTATDAAGKEGPLSLPLRVTVDTTAPRVIHQAPAPGSKRIAVTTHVIAQFNEPVLGVKNDTFSLGRAVAAQVHYNNATQTATLDPDAPLAPKTTYTASLLERISDIAGNRLTPVGWSFTTARSPR